MNTDPGFWQQLGTFSTALFAQLWNSWLALEALVGTSVGLAVKRLIASWMPRIHAWIQRFFTGKVIIFGAIFAFLFIIASFRAYTDIDSRFRKNVSEMEAKQKEIDFLRSQLADRDDKTVPAGVDIGDTDATLEIESITSKGPMDSVKIRRGKPNVKIKRVDNDYREKKCR